MLHPHNTIFLSLFAWNESRNRIEERVRGVIRDITTIATTQATKHDNILNTQVPITSHLFSIYTELNRPVYAGSTLHSVRAAFEKAIADPTSDSSNPDRPTNTSNTGAHSNLTLWKLYILFELSRDNINRAKAIFYRALRACPWSKELVMLAFTHLRADVVKHHRTSMGGKAKVKEEGMGFEELRRVYNVLVEKELRVHVDIEGVLDEIVARKEEGVVNLPIDMPEDSTSDEEMQV